MTAARLPSWDPSQLVLGDATDPGVFEPDLFQLTVTSPPYNVGLAYGDEVDDAGSYEDYLAFSREWLANVHRWTAPSGRLCMNIPLDKNSGGKQPVTADLTNIAREVGWKYHATIIWNEGNISRRTAWGSWRRPSAPHIIAPVETIVVLYKDEWKREHQGDDPQPIDRDEFMAWTSGTWVADPADGGASSTAILPRQLIDWAAQFGDADEPVALSQLVGSMLRTLSPPPAGIRGSAAEISDWLDQIWEFNGESAKRVGHPAPFPIELPRRCIGLLSYEGDRVLDPFAGSGSTLIAAVTARRHAHGIELSETHRQTALERISREVTML